MKTQIRVLLCIKPLRKTPQVATIRARVAIHFTFTGRSELKYIFVLKVVFTCKSCHPLYLHRTPRTHVYICSQGRLRNLRRGGTEAKGVALQHHYYEDADSCFHQKIASILSSSFSPQQLICSPVTAQAGATGLSSHHFPVSPLTYFLDGRAFFGFPALVPPHD